MSHAVIRAQVIRTQHIDKPTRRCLPVPSMQSTGSNLLSPVRVCTKLRSFVADLDRFTFVHRRSRSSPSMLKMCSFIENIISISTYVVLSGSDSRPSVVQKTFRYSHASFAKCHFRNNNLFIRVPALLIIYERVTCDSDLGACKQTLEFFTPSIRRWQKQYC